MIDSVFDCKDCKDLGYTVLFLDCTEPFHRNLCDCAASKKICPACCGQGSEWQQIYPGGDWGDESYEKEWICDTCNGTGLNNEVEDSANG